MLRFVLRRLGAGVFALVCLALVLGAWTVLEAPVRPPDWDGRFSGLTYSPYRPGQDPALARYPSDEEVEADLRLLRRVTRRIRTYASAEGPDIVAIADDLGMTVAAGVWLDGDRFRNEREMRALSRQLRRHRNVERVILGNETQLRQDLPPEELALLLDRLRQRTHVPVSTAEPWGVWLNNPELAKHVDFIAVHVLPYWEQTRAEDAVDYVFDKLRRLRAAYPDKPIVLMETGWPSFGATLGPSVASARNQSLFLREFAERARRSGLKDAFVIEAFDQRWKAGPEGRVGAYWGVFDETRTLKLQPRGWLFVDAGFPPWAAALAGALFVPLLVFGRAHSRWRLGARLVFGVLATAAAGFLLWSAARSTGAYEPAWNGALTAVLALLNAFCLLVLLVQAYETLEVLGLRRWRRRFGVRPLPAVQPKVSLHLACANEDPAMVIASLESLARLEYDNFEVLVVDNNTVDESRWRPLEAWVAAHPERFRFFHLPVCEGFKAGALNFALQHTAADAGIVGVVDADYVVDARWLAELVGHFDDARVAVVQSPQAHRDFEHGPLARMANWEFEGFFRIGMHHRNERNAIIQHGTMTLVRAAALRDGGWATWTVCEDAELGLRLMAQGWLTRYVDRVYGRGLTPASFAAFRGQRQRWALGAMQILRGHADWLLGRGSKLSRAQRLHFGLGWLPWISEAVQLVCVGLALASSAAMAMLPGTIEPPPADALALVFAVPLVRILIGVLGYRMAVTRSWRDIAGAAFASMALGHAIARGVFLGLFSRHAVFVVTQKKPTGASRGRSIAPETAIAAALAVAATAVLASHGPGAAEPQVWAAALGVLALPYLASLAMSWIGSGDRPSAAGLRLDPARDGAAVSR